MSESYEESTNDEVLESYKRYIIDEMWHYIDYSQQPPAKPVVCHDVGNRSKRFRFVRQASAGATSPVYLGVSPRSFGVLRNF